MKDKASQAWFESWQKESVPDRYEWDANWGKPIKQKQESPSFAGELWAGKYHELFPDDKFLPGGKVVYTEPHHKTGKEKGLSGDPIIDNANKVRRRLI